jgi:hypothetical protein
LLQALLRARAFYLQPHKQEEKMKNGPQPVRLPQAGSRRLPASFFDRAFREWRCAFFRQDEGRCRRLGGSDWLDDGNVDFGYRLGGDLDLGDGLGSCGRFCNDGGSDRLGNDLDRLDCGNGWLDRRFFGCDSLGSNRLDRCSARRFILYIIWHIMAVCQHCSEHWLRRSRAGRFVAALGCKQLVRER